MWWMWRVRRSAAVELVVEHPRCHHRRMPHRVWSVEWSCGSCDGRDVLPRELSLLQQRRCYLHRL